MLPFSFDNPQNFSKIPSKSSRKIPIFEWNVIPFNPIFSIFSLISCNHIKALSSGFVCFLMGDACKLSKKIFFKILGCEMYLAVAVGQSFLQKYLNSYTILSIFSPKIHITRIPILHKLNENGRTRDSIAKIFEVFLWIAKKAINKRRR